MVEVRGCLAGFSLLGAFDALESCSLALATFSGERALFFVLRFAVAAVRAIEKKWLLNVGVLEALKL